MSKYLTVFLNCFPAWSIDRTQHSLILTPTHTSHTYHPVTLLPSPSPHWHCTGTIKPPRSCRKHRLRSVTGSTEAPIPAWTASSYHANHLQFWYAVAKFQLLSEPIVATISSSKWARTITWWISNGQCKVIGRSWHSQTAWGLFVATSTTTAAAANSTLVPV